MSSTRKRDHGNVTWQSVGSREIRQKVAALKQVCPGVDEDLASRTPTDRWSLKQKTCIS
ncbi:hypothetical protein GSbR_02320 [Geobacter sp. SVR]|nr:hypothetical protein GSbR_02320 [Geobacter sp. SVR]